MKRISLTFLRAASKKDGDQNGGGNASSVATASTTKVEQPNLATGTEATTEDVANERIKDGLEKAFAAKKAEADKAEAEKLVTVKVIAACVGEGDQIIYRGKTFETTLSRAQALGDEVAIVTPA